MEIISIEGTKSVPNIYCNPKQGLIEIRGKSVLENPMEEVYKDVIRWIRDYAERPREKTTVNIQLEYFNTSSSKCILDAFRVLEKIHNARGKHVVEINWHFDEDDEDMLEAGDDYQAIVKIPFNMIGLKR